MSSPGTQPLQGSDSTASPAGQTSAPAPGDRVSSHPRRARNPLLKKLLPLVAAVVLVGAMVADTKFLSPDEVSALEPVEFDAASFAAAEFPGIVEKFSAEGTPLNDLVPAVEKDAAAAAQQFGGVTISGKTSFATTVTGTVAEVDANFLRLDVDGLPKDVEVRVPVGVPLNGTPVRDAAGYEFADFKGQTDYQSMANELKNIMAADVVGAVDPAALDGTQISVVGAFATGGPPQSYIVQPVAIEVGS